MFDKDGYVVTKWNAMNKAHYLGKGYTFTKMGDELRVRIGDLDEGSCVKVPFTCDVCGATGERAYNQLVKSTKHACGRRCGAVLRKATNLERYGVEHALQSPEILERSKTTCRRHFGVDFSGQAPEVKERRRTTMLEKYGVEHALQVPEFLEKAKETMKVHFGVEHPFQSEQIKEKIKATNRTRYGADHPMQSEKIKAKARRTCEERFGGPTCMSSPEVRAKRRELCQERHGVDNPMQLAEVRERVKATNQAKRGVDWATQSPEVRKKMYKTMMSRYGVEHALQDPDVRSEAHVPTVNGAPASRTQLALGELLGWTVNLRVDRYALDLADAKTKVYIELDGTGHDLPVQLGTMTRRVHKVRQSRRDRSLLADGWRLIRVVSHDDRLPADDVLRGLLNLCTAYLGLGRHWVTVDLDRGRVVGSHLRMRLDGEGRVVG